MTARYNHRFGLLVVLVTMIEIMAPVAAEAIVECAVYPSSDTAAQSFQTEVVLGSYGNSVGAYSISVWFRSPSLTVANISVGSDPISQANTVYSIEDGTSPLGMGFDRRIKISGILGNDPSALPRMTTVARVLWQKQPVMRGWTEIYTNVDELVDTEWKHVETTGYPCGIFTPSLLQIYSDDRCTSDVFNTINWGSFGFDKPGFAEADYDTTRGVLLGRITPDNSRLRVAGWVFNQPEWMPYSAIGSDRYVRVKYYVYAGEQLSGSVRPNIPNLRVRASSRYAVNSMLEVFNHQNNDPANTSLSQELRPSTDPLRPSVYCVDFDPVDVPYLAQHADFEGVLRAFEAYSLDPQDSGYLALKESVIGTYPVAALPDSQTPVHVYAPSASDTGSLKVFNTATDLTRQTLVLSSEVGKPAAVDTSAPLPLYSEGSFGVTLDSTNIPGNRVGIVSREFNPDNNTNLFASRVRVEPSKLYKVRFHVTSTQFSNRNSQLRMRARTLKFAWTQKYEIGGAWGTGGTILNQNNSIAQQVLPGIGCINPDRAGQENGGWYTLLMTTPMDPGLRPDFVAGTPLSVRMPYMSAEPGPGDNRTSRRDLRVGCDLVDTLSMGANAALEKGNFTIDRIEVRVFNEIEE